MGKFRASMSGVGVLSVALLGLALISCQKAMPTAEEFVTTEDPWFPQTPSDSGTTSQSPGGGEAPVVSPPEIPTTSPTSVPPDAPACPSPVPPAVPNPAPCPEPGSPASPVPPSPTPSQPPSPSCITSSPSHLCIGLNLVSYHESMGKTALDRDEAAHLVQKINDLWSACDIGFQLENYQNVDPKERDLSYGNDAQKELNRIRNAFGDDRTFLVVVTGPWLGRTVAWTTLPGGGPFGTILEREAGQNPISVAHELGHYQGLKNSSNSRNLMSGDLSASSVQLTPDQCRKARSADRKYWRAMLRGPQSFLPELIEAED